ncbi:hypothetical protein ACN38_g12498 [Penicillium nordicum]|uniref:Uncharacterized protein n=1 Tax=Penicillium nordicum TaxID=229535 RepID=A0A0M8NQM2_9EURO|nr:hypothetical protein ACN38_g12498 [Penicillium nordicum]
MIELDKEEKERRRERDYLTQINPRLPLKMHHPLAKTRTGLLKKRRPPKLAAKRSANFLRIQFGSNSESIRFNLLYFTRNPYVSVPWVKEHNFTTHQHQVPTFAIISYIYATPVRGCPPPTEDIVHPGSIKSLVSLGAFLSLFRRGGDIAPGLLSQAHDRPYHMRRLLAQPIQYMLELDVKFGWLSTYHQSICLRQTCFCKAVLLFSGQFGKRPRSCGKLDTCQSVG